jgi:hypothetical protein
MRWLNPLSWSRNSMPSCMEHKGLLSYVQKYAVDPYREPDEFNVTSHQLILILSSHLQSVRSSVFLSCFPTKTFYAFRFTLLYFELKNLL